jgi:hypothetical protein
LFFTPTESFTSTPTLTETSAWTETPTQAPSLTITTTPLSTPPNSPQEGAILHPVLAPVPIRQSQTFCLYQIDPSSQIRLEFFDPTGLMSGFSFATTPNHCWSASDLPIGLYWVRIRTINSAGHAWTGTQKVLVIP